MPQRLGMPVGAGQRVIWPRKPGNKDDFSWSKLVLGNFVAVPALFGLTTLSWSYRKIISAISATGAKIKVRISHA